MTSPQCHPAILLTLLCALLAACSHTPRFTPADVQPPASLQALLDDADVHRASRHDPLSLDQPTSLTLTRDGAILTAVARNRSLAVERFNPLIAETSIGEARAAFDPTLLATLSAGRSIEQLGGSRFSSSSSQNSSTSRDITGEVRAENTFATGTEVFLSGGLDRSRTSFTSTEHAGNWSLGVTQSLLRGAGTSVNLVELRQARNDTAIGMHQLRDFVLELVRQVEVSYWDLVLAYSTLEIREFSVRLAREQLRLNEIYLEVGKGVAGDVTSARAALASREADLIDARAEVRRRTILLMRLLNPSEAEHYAVTLNPLDPPDVEEVVLDPSLSMKLAELYRPDLAESKLRIANGDLELIRTRNGLLPRLDFFATYGRTSLGLDFSGGVEYLDDTDYDNYELGLDFEVQPLNRAERARQQRAEFELAQAEAAVANLEQLIDAQVQEAAVEARRQWERIGATATTVAAREEELRAVREEFDVGLATTLDVLAVQERLVQARLDAATAKVRYIEGLTELYWREGTLLERRGVGVDAPPPGAL
ncbi:MAG: outer membrane protein [Candidatus Sumerlaeota bacterium]|nr:outer membrane protein [Candidatus Sumerlaeota bacterium]